MASRDRRNPHPKQDLIRSLKIAGVTLGLMVVVLILMRAGVMQGIAGLFIWQVTAPVREEGERQRNQPRTVVLTNGERIECRKVNDQGKYWGLTRTDGRIMAVKKEEVLAIEEPAAAGMSPPATQGM